ncbi:MAG: acylphosphatase [Patescibacteria group bacterium]
MIRQTHLYIKGDVIGVGFRAWTKIQAKIFGVRGWVKNSFDKKNIFGAGGGVEALLQGEDEVLQKMILIIKEGSPVSRVEDVEVYEQEITEIYEGFEIRK